MLTELRRDFNRLEVTNKQIYARKSPERNCSGDFLLYGQVAYITSASSSSSFRLARAPTIAFTGSPPRNTMNVGMESTL